LFWLSKLQTKIALSTTKAEYIALSQVMRALLLLCSLLLEVGTKLDLKFSTKSVVKTCVWEDNNGVLVLATDPMKISVQTKYMAIKYHFFCHYTGDNIHILKVDTMKQLADLFTKGLPAHAFQALTDKLMGWDSGDLYRVSSHDK